MSDHDAQNPFSNETGEYLQEESSQRNLSKEKPSEEQVTEDVPAKRPYNKRK